MTNISRTSAIILTSIIGVFLGSMWPMMQTSHAITQTVNETNGINYGIIQDIYKKGSTYFLSVDYIQFYQGYEAALARAEDGVLFGDLDVSFDQDFPESYYTTKSNGAITATKATKKKILAYLSKLGKKKYTTLTNTISSAEVFNNLPEIERMIIGPSFSPSQGRGSNYMRNTNPKIRNIPFSPSAKINVEGEILSLAELLEWQENPTQSLIKVSLKKGKIEGLRIDYHS